MQTIDLGPRMRYQLISQNILCVFIYLKPLKLIIWPVVERNSITYEPVLKSIKSIIHGRKLKTKIQLSKPQGLFLWVITHISHNRKTHVCTCNILFIAVLTKYILKIFVFFIKKCSQQVRKTYDCSRLFD